MRAWNKKSDPIFDVGPLTAGKPTTAVPSPSASHVGKALVPWETQPHTLILLEGAVQAGSHTVTLALMVCRPHLEILNHS